MSICPFTALNREELILFVIVIKEVFESCLFVTLFREELTLFVIVIEEGIELISFLTEPPCVAPGSRIGLL